MAESMYVLAIDTCGPSGSVALGRLSGQSVEILAQTELAGRSYSATLIAAVAELLTSVGVELKQLRAIVAVSGPGSFTGVRVGLSAVKGLAEPAAIPVVAVSRLAVLAFKSNVPSVALDAHRHEVFLRTALEGAEARELLAGAAELAAFNPAHAKIAVCDDAAAELFSSSWPLAELIRVAAPTAGDALELAAPLILAGNFVDLALLDGHYLRRSDAEIFGEPRGRRAAPPMIPAEQEFRIRRMTAADLEAVLALAQSLPHSPQWPRVAYQTALNAETKPRRVALVAEDAASNALAGFLVASLTPPEAELETIAVAIEFQRRGVARHLFQALANEFRRDSITDVVLEVRASNQPAQALYRALEFAQTGLRPRYYADPVEDAILMRFKFL